MGRTVPSASQLFFEEEQMFKQFRRALRKPDQLALDDLFAQAKKHVAEIGYAAHIRPFETIVLAMLVEEHKEMIKIKERLDSLPRRRPAARPVLTLQAPEKPSHSE
jgi:hypothetical protein